MFRFDRDLHIPEIDLWLDSTHVKPFGFVSHGHTDHMARHKKILCTPATAEFVRLRMKNPHEIFALPFGETLSINAHQISLHPAGHILGSAQILIRHNGQRLLYTGDFRLGPSRTVEMFEWQSADILIMETTFGKTHYRMPERSQAEDELVETCRTLLRQNRIPIVFAYALGKGQEALKILTDAGLPVAVDQAIARFVPVYEQNNIAFNPYELFDRDQNVSGRILLLPANFRYQRFFKNLSRGYTIYLSGWGMDGNARQRFGVDRVIPLSDHADYQQLWEVVEKVRPQVVYCTHGFPEFVADLRASGYQANVLSATTE